MTDSPDPVRIAYLCCSQFSGSTLTSFLLGCHSRIATIGHTTGWRYSAEEDFRCSCGQRIADCRLFVEVSNAFDEAGLAFDPRDFGTAFRLSNWRRINQLLLEYLPILRLNAVDDLRDKIVDLSPGWKQTIDRQLQANRILMQTVLRYFDAKVYLDNSHSPHRLKRLSKSPLFQPVVIHLIRDPRGVSRSLMRNSGLTCKEAISAWLSHQKSIARIAARVCKPMLLRYEDLCLDTNSQLARIHAHCSLDVEEFGGNFMEGEHHILGNRMRLSVGDISLDDRWRDELSSAERNLIDNRLCNYLAGNADSKLAPVIRAYLDDD